MNYVSSSVRRSSDQGRGYRNNKARNAILSPPALNWKQDYNCYDSKRIHLLRGVMQAQWWKIPCVIFVPDYTNVESPRG